MRALVLGQGRMGKLHAKVLRDLGYAVTTVDPNPDTGAKYDKIPIGVFYDAACVAVPIVHLAEAAHDADRVCKKMLIEKPGAASADQMRILKSAIGLTQPAVGYTERFNPIVRALRGGLTAEQRADIKARFVRWNPAPSPDVWLDLISHDVDLCRFLGFADGVYEARGNSDERVRNIHMVNRSGGTRTVSLLNHTQSPLHAQWHAMFLPGRSGLASLDDAEAVLRIVEDLKESHLQERVA